ncbi:nucleoside recognition domain-containing protein [Tissierella sp.]|uniref:nucleoside recognition domain-containing protein n=1 Tax=Tissierella sp. TaxID=41274 RepID=UPI002865F207|nr:nucleoside recognition domain-containing protein [Tissierella sp.]MDR7857014.1 nucleoside recognition domain-containing protein [Tissierella sp.]
MDFWLYIKESSTGALGSVITMAKIIIPLMIAMEIFKSLDLIDKISKKMRPIARFLNISNEAVLPLIIGLIFGLSYGAGVIIESVEENNLSKKDLYTLMIFLIACHAVIEDTLLFVVIGANLWLLLGVRVGVAIIISYFASKVLNRIELKI